MLPVSSENYFQEASDMPIKYTKKTAFLLYYYLKWSYICEII